jgi:hypothetical protein
VWHFLGGIILARVRIRDLLTLFEHSEFCGIDELREPIIWLFNPYAACQKEKLDTNVSVGNVKSDMKCIVRRRKEPY